MPAPRARVSPRAGRLIQQQTGPDGYAAFIPAPLPPEPPIDFNVLHVELERAAAALARLDGLSRGVHPDTLLYAYVRKEAVLSSQIEGTQSTLADLLQYESAEAPGAPLGDVREVSHYVQALQHGVARLRGGMPMSLRLIREVHAELLRDGRGAHQAPGEFRRSQNWIGGTRPGAAHFVPPPPHEVMPALGALERFLHEGAFAPVVKAGLAHAQFESIHPFLDGNGRVGRLLITLLFVADGVLSEPFLYLSLYFKRHRSAYYDALQAVRTHGDWEGWLRFYLEGVHATATEAIATTTALLALFAADRERVRGLGRAAPSALRVYEHLQQRVIISAPRTAEALELALPTVGSALARLEQLGIVREITGRQWGRQYAYAEQLRLLAPDDDTPPA